MFNNNNKIKIAILKISDQNKAILEFYFSSVGDDFYTVVDRDQADAFIMDYDYPQAKEHLTKIQSINNKPLAIISISEQNITNTVWLAKPLSAKALTDAADTLKQLIMATENDIQIEEVEPIASLEKETVSLNKSLPEKELSDIKFEQGSDDNNVLEFAQSENLEKEVDSLTMAKAASLASSKLGFDFSNNSENKELKDTLDFTDSSEEEKISLNTEDKNLAFAKTIVEDQHIQNGSISDDAEDPEVEALLDSLLLEEESSVLEVVSDAHTDLDDSVNTDIDTTDTLLNELTLEVETNLEEQIEEVTESTNINNPVETEEQNSLLVEDFTLHDDINPSTEDTYANTLEVDLPKVSQDRSDQNIGKSKHSDESLELPQIDEDLESTPEMLQELTLETKPLIQKADKSKPSEDQLESNSLDFGSIDLEESSDQSIDAINNTSKVDKAESDLDSLLKEVSEDNDISLDEKEQVTPEIPIEVSKINEDFESALITKEPSDTDNDSSDVELQSLLNEIREEAGKNTTSDSKNSVSSEPNSYEKTKAEKRWAQLCGDHKGIQNQKEVKGISFSVKDYLLDVLLKQIAENDNSEQVDRLKYNDLIIVIDHSKSQVFCNLPLTEDMFVGICGATLKLEDIKIHDLDYSEVRLYRKKIEENPDRAHSIESFIWTTTLLTSRGRLPEKTDVSKPVGLKAWPDLTRVELMPHAMQIAAVFSKHPASLLEIPKLIGIEQRYVFAFYNAALSLDLIELDGNKLKKSSISFKKNGSKDIKENRGFFGRLLKRLKS